MSSPRRTRRSAEQWREIASRFQNSPLNAPNFCSKEGIGYASFIKWKRRLQSDSVVAEKFAEFVELTPPTPSPPRSCGADQRRKLSAQRAEKSGITTTQKQGN